VLTKVYAFQAKGPELVKLAIETRAWAERRLVELMEEDRKAGKLAKGSRGDASNPGPGRGKEGVKTRFPAEPCFSQPTLEEQGVQFSGGVSKIRQKQRPLHNWASTRTSVSQGAVSGGIGAVVSRRMENGRPWRPALVSPAPAAHSGSAMYPRLFEPALNQGRVNSFCLLPSCSQAIIGASMHPLRFFWERIERARRATKSKSDLLGWSRLRSSGDSCWVA